MRIMIVPLLLLLSVSGWCQFFAFSAQSEPRPTVFVSILPQVYFVERIGGQDFKVEVLVGPGQSPATYEPTPKQMAELSGAAAFFRIGVPFENNLVKKVEKTVRNLKVIDTRQGIKAPSLEYIDTHGEHHIGHEDMDPHIWLDPMLAKTISRNILEGLSDLNPAGSESYKNNYDSLAAELDALDAEIREILGPLKKTTFYVFHPAFGYFGSAYGLEQVAVEIGGREPGARQVADLIERARKEGARVIFVQPQFSTKSARTIADAIDGAVVPVDPLAEDYIANLREIARHLAEGLRAGSE